MVDLDAQLRAWTATWGMPWEGLARLVLAAVAAGMVGLEREIRGRQAGFRTTILISVGAALAMIVSCSFAQRPWPHDSGFTVNVDPARVAYGIMTGIGLLCAGAIIKEGPTVHGLTTAAALWCAAALGLAAGLGLYLLTVGAALLVVAVLWLVQNAEFHLPRVKFAQVIVRRDWDPQCVASTVAELTADGLHVTDIDFTRLEGTNSVEIELRIGFSARSRFFQLVQKIEAHPDLELRTARNL
ncbi:MAG: MgtC/SapB family protein [Tepidisphaeraceae bacterium]|jgi:putative Mg2+ transporter-C (MgtC) family protein